MTAICSTSSCVHEWPLAGVYHEIVKSLKTGHQASLGAARCDVLYQAPLSPDFYASPYGATTGIGKGRVQQDVRRDERRSVCCRGGAGSSCWYRNDHRRERFVAIYRDRGVPQLMFDGHMTTQLVQATPLAPVRCCVKNLAHFTGLATA